MSLIDVAAEVATLVEPAENITRVALDVEPLTWLADHLYVITDRNEYIPFESGPAVRQEFDLRIILVVSQEGEEARKERTEELARFLDEKRGSYMDLLRRYAQREPFWDFGQTASVISPRTLSNRGLAVRFSGYRILS